MSGVFAGIMIPSIGITAGAACMLSLRNAPKPNAQKAFLGFASGVMVAASVWPLLILLMDMSGYMDEPAFAPASAGFLLGTGFLFLLNEVIPHLHVSMEQPGGPKSGWRKSTTLVLAVILYNTSEGMAVDVVFAGSLSQNGTITLVGVLVLSVDIAIQDFPEGATISLSFKEAAEKGKALIYGTFSGAVEPIGAVLMLVLAELLGLVLPCFLSFVAGAMIYVVAEELIPESAEGRHLNVAVIGSAVGPMVMMILGMTPVSHTYSRAHETPFR